MNRIEEKTSSQEALARLTKEGGLTSHLSAASSTGHCTWYGGFPLQALGHEVSGSWIQAAGTVGPAVEKAFHLSAKEGINKGGLL